MKIQEYQIEAKRTLVELDNADKDRQHMLMGIISEIGEIVDVYKKKLAYNKPFDKINLKEECADVTWYLVNWATIEDEFLETPEIDNSFIDEDSTVEIDIIFDFLINEGLHLGRIQQTLNRWYTTCLKLGLTQEEFEQGLENNIEKLKIRFPEKFTKENALNRNLEQERKTLEK